MRDLRSMTTKASCRSFVVCLMVVGAGVAVWASPVAAQQSPATGALLQACGKIVAFHDGLTTAHGKPTKTTFDTKSDVRRLRAIAVQLKDVPGAQARATNLRKATAGTPRRKAIATTYRWCDTEGAFAATTLTVAPRFDAVDTDAPAITGMSAPGASVLVTGNGTSYRVTADATGAFSVAIPNIPLDTDVQLRVSSTEPNRSASYAATFVRRTRSQAAIEAEASAQAEAARAAEEGFKAQAVEVPYNELVKYGPGTVGQAVTYRTKVFQFDFNTGSDQFLGYVTPGNYIWDGLVLFKLPDAALGNGILKDDIVRVWGTVGAPYSYSTRQGTNSVPTVSVKYIETA